MFESRQGTEIKISNFSFLKDGGCIQIMILNGLSQRWHVILGAWSQIVFIFHTKGWHSVSATSPEELKKFLIQILMVPSSGQLLNSWISPFLLYNQTLLPISTTYLIQAILLALKTLSMSPRPSQAWEPNAGLRTKMSRTNTVKVGAQEK